MLMLVETDEQYARSERYGAANGHHHRVGVALGVTRAVARVDHGRWLADCPFGCGSARDLHPDRGYWCAHCGNVAVDGQEIPVAWPDGYEELEAALVLRPDMATRNWRPGETVDDLKAENEAHGVGA